MYTHDATEIAYNNGYKKGFEDGRKSVNLVLYSLCLSEDLMTADIDYELNGERKSITCSWRYKDITET